MLYSLVCRTDVLLRQAGGYPSVSPGRSGLCGKFGGFSRFSQVAQACTFVLRFAVIYLAWKCKVTLLIALRLLRPIIVLVVPRQASRRRERYSWRSSTSSSTASTHRAAACGPSSGCRPRGCESQAFASPILVTLPGFSVPFLYVFLAERKPSALTGVGLNLTPRCRTSLSQRDVT